MLYFRAGLVRERILQRRYAPSVNQEQYLGGGGYMDFTALEGFQYPLQCSVGIREAPIFLDRVPFVAGDGLRCRDQEGIIREENDYATRWII